MGSYKSAKCALRIATQNRCKSRGNESGGMSQPSQPMGKAKNIILALGRVIMTASGALCNELLSHRKQRDLLNVDTTLLEFRRKLVIHR